VSEEQTEFHRVSLRTSWIGSPGLDPLRGVGENGSVRQRFARVRRTRTHRRRSDRPVDADALRIGDGRAVLRENSGVDQAATGRSSSRRRSGFVRWMMREPSGA
jgi:hypothetical protein